MGDPTDSANQSPASVPERAWVRPALVVAIVLGFVVRIVILCISTGSIDATLWERFATEINQQGLYDTYRFDAWMNHPPIPALFAAMTLKLAGSTGIPFPVLFKIPQILADGVACWILYQIYRQRDAARSSITGLLAAALFAWNLDALLLSAFHCNTDPLYSMFCLAAVWLADTKRRPMLAGVAMGAALNIKLLPAMLILPMFLLAGSLREILWIAAGLASMSPVMLWVWLDLGYRFRQRVMGYSPTGGWGITLILYELNKHPLFHKYAQRVLDDYSKMAKFFVMICTALPALLIRQTQNWSRYRAMALATVVFVIISPAFAIQYAAMVGMLLIAYDLKAGTIWGILAGLRTLSMYVFLWPGDFPISAHTGLGTEGTAPFFGALCWGWSLLWLSQQLKLILIERKQHT